MFNKHLKLNPKYGIVGMLATYHKLIIHFKNWQGLGSYNRTPKSRSHNTCNWWRSPTDGGWPSSSLTSNFKNNPSVWQQTVIAGRAYFCTLNANSLWICRCLKTFQKRTGTMPKFEYFYGYFEPSRSIVLLLWYIIVITVRTEMKLFFLIQIQITFVFLYIPHRSLWVFATQLVSYHDISSFYFPDISGNYTLHGHQICIN